MALIFTLGILTILMVLGLAFVMLSQTNRKLAAVNSDVTTAKLLAESALERVVKSLQLYHNDVTGSPSSFFLMPDSGYNDWNNRRVTVSSEDGGDTDWIHNFKTSYTNSADNSLNYISWNGAPSSINDKVKSSWQYIITNDGFTKKIIGRIAYMIIDESGKIDPNRVTASGINEALFDESRFGVDVSEINLQGAGVSSASAASLGYDNAGGKRPVVAKWFSWAHIIGATSFSQPELDSYSGSLFPFSYDIEAFHDASDGKDYHRFNLARIDWDTLTINNIKEAPVPWSDSTKTHDGTGIPWLKNWTGTEKDQIIANLLDYCDTDSIPHTDYVAGGSPTYVGLEKTAYINEIQVSISQAPVVKAAAMGGASYTWIPVVISITPEIVNVYAEEVPACNLELKYEINGVVNKGHVVSYKLKSLDAGVPVEGLSGTLTYNFLAATAAHSFQIVLPQPLIFLGDSYVTPDEGTPVNLTITDIKLTAFLKDSGGNLIDFAAIASEAAPVDLDVHPSAKYANYQANDPRQNHFLVNWNTKTGDIDQGSLGLNNTGVCIPGASGDREPRTDPWVSTCYIRNAPMQSPWELGTIHRGASWETINLKAFSAGTVGGSYANGDANILDQVKMTSDTVNSGKVNINSTSKDALKALCRNIYVKESYAMVGTIPPDSNQVTSSCAGEIADAIIAESTVSAFKNRAEVAKVAKLWNNSVGGGTLEQTTDATREEIIGKFVNLTTVRQNLFTVIILAQAIKDVGGIAPSEITIVKDLNSDGDVDGPVVEKWDIDGNGVDNDTLPAGTKTIAAQLGRYDQYADEIVSEQKILAVIYRDAFTNKCKIIYYEYLSD